MPVARVKPRSSKQAEGESAATARLALLDSHFMLLALGAAVVAYALAAAAIAEWWTPPLPDTSFLLPEIRVQCNPEPVERALYLLGLFSAATLPPLFYFGLRALQRRRPAAFDSWTDERVLSRRDQLLGVGFLVWFCSICFATPFRTLLVWTLLALPLVWLMAPKFWRALEALAPRRIYFLAGLGLLFCFSKDMVFNDSEFQQGADLKHHLDVLMAPIHQVSLGRTILVDTTSQYGILFPYAIAWLLKPFGIGVTSVSCAFAALAFLTGLFVYLAIGRKVGRDSALGLWLLASFLGLTHPLFTKFFLLTFLTAPRNVYFQYYPLRVIETAFFFWFVRRYFDRPGPRWLALGYLLAGVGALWNLDTGLVVLVAWTLTQMFAEWSRRGSLPRTVLRSAGHAAAAAASLALAIGLYWLFARWRSGQFPSLGEVTQYQQRFYVVGLMMLPMKLWEWWQLPVALLAGVLFGCIRRSFARDASADAPWYFFISLTGFGLFSYYQGRSHGLNILHVIYPAALLCCFLTVDLQRRLGGMTWREAMQGARTRFDALQLLSLNLMLSIGLCLFTLGVGPELYSFAQHRIEWRERPLFALDYADLRSILEGLPVVALTEQTTFDHIETGSIPALPYATPNDIVAWDDVRVARQVMARPDVEYVLTQRDDVPGQYFDELCGRLDFSRFEVVKRFTMFSLWKRRPPSPRR